jgi:sarcosine oxidase subunit alpha
MRLPGKGLTPDAPEVGITWDGRPLRARQGETLAAALLAHDIRLVGRSFKYHRPRGILTAGAEEPNALVTVGTGAEADPNTRATVQECFEGLQAASQNRWPSLAFDLMAVNDLAAPFLSAGFYYKTFMWPRPFWERLYEPLIRRAAGLGALSGQANRDAYEKAFAHCDLLVIGGGPAGLMAALVAGRAGAKVILADEDSRLGGRLNSETEEVDGEAGADWAAVVARELASLPNVRLMTRTTVTGAYDDGSYGALERVGHHRPRAPHLPRDCFWRIRAARAILAAGAIERPIAFPMNDRPGVMTAGAVRTYLNRWGVAPGRTAVVFGNNDDAHRTARDLTAAGITVAAMVDSRPETRAEGGYPSFAGAEVTGTAGRLGLRTVTFRHRGESRTVAADLLAVSGGWSPTVHLTSHLGRKPVWRESILAFVPADGAVPGMTVAGAAKGTFSTAGALAEGAEAARAACEALGRHVPPVDLPGAEDAPVAISPLWVVPGKGRAWIDFQNDVTVKDIRLAAQENMGAVEHMKRYTTQGMATDQGKTGNVTALAVLAEATGRAVAERGTTTFRPPYTPVPIAAMGAGGQGHGFAPRRLTTSHRASADRGAHMIEAGLWYRAAWFPRAGETTWRQSCDREVGMVRGVVGVCDVSTLGKIDIQGPDAAAFLDFVYCNTFSTLAPGRVRYGLMLREDGHVMDDGTCARLGPDHYVITTTTAAAGEVMRHLEFVLQVLKPHWDVQVVSVTEQWAQFSIAGPRSRDLVAAMVEGPVGDAEVPYMACGPVAVMGVAGRLFRISFSGERAYEIAVPARFGDALWRLLVAQAEAMGGGAYGLEALNVLRIEKGFITHAEIHGRTTAFDIGMERMVSPKKDCVGWAASRRPGLLAEDREQMVGLVAVAPEAPMTAGAHLFDDGAAAVRVNDQGYVTSVCWSPTLQTNLGLGFLKGGRARHGQVIRLVDHLRGIDTPVRVTDPVFFDPEGGRLRG